MAELLMPWQREVLAAFLRMKAAQPHIWGKSDCGLMLADWMMMAKGLPDPAEAVRGRYSDAAGAATALGEGGLLGFVGHCAQACECPPTDAPIDGDGAVIDLPGVGQTGALMAGGSWAFKTPSGIAWSRVTPGRLLQAWAVFHA